MISPYDIIHYVSKSKDTLGAIFAEPTRANIPWRAIESLFRYHGAEINPGRGSRVRVVLKVGSQHVRATFHRPHPEREAHKTLVRSVRRFLEEAGVTP